MVERGRALAIRCVVDDVELIFVGVHLVPEATIASRRRLLRRTHGFVPADRAGGMFVGGDFNTIVNAWRGRRCARRPSAADAGQHG